MKKIDLKLHLDKQGKYTFDLLDVDVLHFDNKKKGLKYLAKLSKLLQDYTHSLFQAEIEIYTLYRKYYVQLGDSSTYVEENLQGFNYRVNFFYEVRTSENTDLLNSFVGLFNYLNLASDTLLEFSKNRKLPHLKYDIYAIRKRLYSLKHSFIKDLYDIDNSLKHR